MGSRKKSLAQELEELFNPAPTKEYDPDVLELGDGAKLPSDDEYGEARVDPSKRAAEKPLLLRGDIVLEDAAYRGRRTSRAAMFGNDVENEDLDDGKGHKSAASTHKAALGSGRSSSDNKENKSGSGLHSDTEDGDEDGLRQEGLTDEEDGSAEDVPRTGHVMKKQAKRAEDQGRASGRGGAVGNVELEDLEAEYDVLEEEDERQLEALWKKGERDREKGVAVRNQQVLYERTLEQRILLQKCLQASNGLPRPETFAALAIAKPDVRDGYSKLAAAAEDTLSQLLELQHVLMARNSAITVPQQLPAAAAIAATDAQRAAAKRRRQDDDDDNDDVNTDRGRASGLELLWRRMSSYHEALVPFRDASVDSWHRRTVLSSGSGALRNSGLRALNQSISSQVTALMRDPAKFIKRTRLVLSACPRVLCENPRESTTAGALDPLRSDGEPTVATWGLPSSSVAMDLAEEERDPETYDDSEFYQQLLKEFLDKGLVEGSAAAPKVSKKRKLVDRRASKGRKLRYHVQEKLVAFMAPVEFTPPPFAVNLFSNLFGHAGK